jgi:hypothetical protein
MIVRFDPFSELVTLIFLEGEGDDAREVFVSNLSRDAAFYLLDELRRSCAKMHRAAN